MEGFLVAKQTIHICDRCEKQVPEDGMISFVEVTFGGHGAAKDTVNGIDLCRGCYSGLIRAIRDWTTKPAKEGPPR
jgi:hypothetical protein